MKLERIQYYLDQGLLRKRTIDTQRLNSLLSSAKDNSDYASSLEINEKSSTAIFKELYDCFRQLGDAKLLLLGYESQGKGSHEVSIEAIQEEKVDFLAFNNLDRFRRLRNDANYKGYKATVADAQDISNVWKNCGNKLINLLRARFPK